jgi:hypothetical protein
MLTGGVACALQWRMRNFTSLMQRCAACLELGILSTKAARPPLLSVEGPDTAA